MDCLPAERTERSKHKGFPSSSIWNIYSNDSYPYIVMFIVKQFETNCVLSNCMAQHFVSWLENNACV